MVWQIAAGLVILVWVLSGFLLRTLSSGEVLGGTSMGGIGLGGQTRERAAELIAEIEPRTAKPSGAGRIVTVRAPLAGGLTIESTGEEPDAGEQFSLNGVAGERTSANGYKPAPTIGEGNNLIDTVGGDSFPLRQQPGRLRHHHRPRDRRR